MKKIVLLLMVLLVFSSAIFATESFWCLNATTNVSSSGDHYRFNYSTVFDLSNNSAFTTNNGNPRYSDYASQSRPNNPLNSSRAIGTVGVADCAHSIVYTVNTNGGRFVSQSDPSKYREFYVVNVPDFSSSKGKTSRFYYLYDTYTSTSSVAPNTKDGGTLSLTTPITNSTENVSDRNRNASDTSGTYTSIGLDLFLCMKTLTDADLEHLSENDDYIATVTVSWHCNHAGCTENHSGTFDMVVRGYYGSNSGQARDSFLLIVNPAPDASTLDLKQMIKDNQTKTIASMRIATTTKEGTSGNAYAWRDHIYAFLSASADYTTSDYSGFVLTKMTNRSITIPYTLTVYNTTSGSSMEGQVFDGTDHFIEHDQSYCIDLKDYSRPSTNYYTMSYDRYGTYYYAINYSGRVDINLTNFTIPGTSVDLRTAVTDPVTYNDEYTRYIGKYESNIYYHIVFVD